MGMNVSSWGCGGCRCAQSAPLRRRTPFAIDAVEQEDRVTGDKAQHYPATDMLHIDHVRIYAQSDSGAKINALALEGRVTDSGDLLTLTGQAYGIRHAMGDRPQLELRGEELRILPDEDQLLSDLPVQITRDRDVFTGNTMDFNSNTGEYLLQGRVRGILAPKPKP